MFLLWHYYTDLRKMLRQSSSLLAMRKTARSTFPFLVPWSPRNTYFFRWTLIQVCRKPCVFHMLNKQSRSPSVHCFYIYQRMYLHVTLNFYVRVVTVTKHYVYSILFGISIIGTATRHTVVLFYSQSNDLFPVCIVVACNE